MFECRACVIRCIRAIAGDTFNTPSLTRRPLFLTPRLSPQTARRAAFTTKPTRNDASNTLTPGKQPIEDDSKDDGTKTRGITIRNENALRIELRYLDDPLKLASHVHYTLRSNKPDKALDLCRLASKKRQDITVSWNHCVDWHMSKGRIDDAIKIYNEMKKRAQFPDSYTYMLLLRGLAKPHHHGGEVKQANVVKAVSVYHSMSSPTSRVRPNVKHTNAVLKVCSEALDMDALWGVASKLPSHGAGAPDHITYAILLNAIRHGAFGKNPDHTYLEQISARRSAAVQEGRKLWQEVIAKWRSGEIHVDEELVCAMGRLLLFSKHMQDWDDILSLVHQTMKIPRLTPPLGHPDRKTEHVPREDHDTRESEPEPEDSAGYTDTPSHKAFQEISPLPRDTAHSSRPTSLAWVQPGNPTLSMLIGACTLLHTPKTAVAYWDHLTTSPHNLKPDLANFHAQLRLLGKNRASAKAATLLKQGMPAAGVAPKIQTFRIAMSVCVRDKKNSNALDYARAIVDVMESTHSDPDVHTLIQYLSLALATDSGARITATLNRLDPIVHNLRSRVTFGTDEAVLGPEKDLLDKEETVLLFRTMVGVMDGLMNRGLVPREDYGYWHGRRSQLNQFIERSRRTLERERVGLEAKGKLELVERRGGQGRGDGEGSEGRDGGRGEGLRMSKAEWELKKFRWKEKREGVREVNRRKAVGVRKWDFAQARREGEGGGGRVRG